MNNSSEVVEGEGGRVSGHGGVEGDGGWSDSKREGVWTWWEETEVIEFVEEGGKEREELKERMDGRYVVWFV